MRPVSSRHSTSEADGLRAVGREALQHRVVGDRVAGVVAALRHHGAQHPVAGAAERRVDGARIARRRAPDQRLVGAFEVAGAAVIGEGVRQRAMRRVGLGDDHDAAGVLVEAVDDARAA